VHPTRGDNNNPGTSTLEPFRTVRHALESPTVQAAVNLGGGTDVIVRIIASGTEDVGGDITSRTLTAGSVTVLPDSGVNFTLNLNNKLLTLNKGYRLQGFKIESRDPGGSNAKAAITLAAAGTPLKDMLIDCRGLGSAGNATDGVGSGDRCIEVTAFSATSATVTLDNVDVLITGDKDFTAGIRHVGTNTILRVINGSSVVATGPASGNQGVVGILENSNGGSVEIEGPNTEVNLSAISPPTSGTPKPNVAILLKGNSGPLRKVINSQIKVKEPTLPATQGQIGVCVGSTINVTVQGNTFTNSSSGSNSIAICRQYGSVIPPTPLPPVNTFIDFSTPPPDTAERRFLTSSSSPPCSCP
jgi:hypothetical protein